MDQSKRRHAAGAERSADRAMMLGLLSTVSGAVLAAMSGAPALAQDIGNSSGGAEGAASAGAASATTASSAPSLIKVATSAATANVSEVIITAAAPTTGSANNIPVPLIETTQALNVLTNQDLQLASVTSFNDVARLASGTYQPGSRAGFTQLYFRGFISNFNDFPLKIDGFRSDAAIIPEMYIYDSVQIYLGAAATITVSLILAASKSRFQKAPKTSLAGRSPPTLAPTTATAQTSTSTAPSRRMEN
jgi:outer membrane receptor for ferric coprogen and ferric-rhodotorulic acid